MKKHIMNFLNRIIKMPIGFDIENSNCSGQIASDIIKKELLANKPTLICKIGWTEANCILSCTNLILSKYDPAKYIIKLSTNAKRQISEASGFFPNDQENIVRFSRLFLDELSNVDVLGSWMKQEKYFYTYLKQAKMIRASAIDPFFHDKPWTQVLEGKKVLVIHPFQESIEKQYKRRERLFKNKQILPEFDLITIKSVQSRANNKVDFESWWEALEYLKREIDKREFDIALVGCGSYSLPVSSYIKRINKKAIHLGGNTQLLFGIIGSRWENLKHCSNLFNKDWIRPLPADTPPNIHTKDSYW